MNKAPPPPTTTTTTTTSQLFNVSIVDIANAFRPSPIPVNVGDRIRWTNNDGIAHTTTSTDTYPWDSRRLDTGERFTWTFDTPGTFDYFCSIHQGMRGQVVVKP